MKKIVIIGGGIAGLSTAYWLKETGALKGATVTVLERTDRLGGNIKTEKVDGFLVEGGPDSFLSEKPWAMALCKRLGLDDRLLPTSGSPKTYVFTGGRLHVLPEGVILMVPTKAMPLMTSSLLTFWGKLRMGMDLFIPKRTDTGDESLGSFVRRRLGKEALEKIAEPLIAGVHAGNPERMSIRATFPKFVQMEEEYGSLIKAMLAKMTKVREMMAKKSEGGKKPVTMFMSLKGGLTDLVDAVIDSLKDNPGDSLDESSGKVELRTGVAVSGVEKSGEGYKINIKGADSIYADAVVIATPAWAAAEAVKGLDAGLSEKLSAIPYASTATVSLAYDKSQLTRPLDGFGFVVARTAGRRIIGATWTSEKWAHRAPEGKILIRCFVGGSKNEELVFSSDEELVRMAREELEDIIGVTGEPLFTRPYKWIKAMPQYTIGHEGRAAAIMEAAAAHDGLYFTGSAYRGIGISDTIREAEATAKSLKHFIDG